MRCPKCKFISADKRDLCPKCLLDLRPEKLRIGLPVSRPKASYEDLVKLAKNKKGKSKNSNSEGPSKTAATAPAPAERIESEQTPAPVVETKEKQKPIWSRLLTKFTLSTPKKKIVVEEKLTITHLIPEVETKVEAPMQATIAPVEPTTVGIDEKAFESIFDEIPDTEEYPIAAAPVNQVLAEPVDPPIPEAKSEPSDEDFIKLGEEMSMKLAQAITSTELLRELPSTTYVSQISQATPEVVEFHEDDDALLEEQLNQLLGDEIVEISSVKVPKKATPAPQANSIKVDDLEISFEFDMENSQETAETPKVTGEQVQETVAPPTFESKSINQLEAALLALDAEFGAPVSTVEIDDEEEVGGEELVELSESLLESEVELSDDEESLEEIDTLESLKNDLMGLDDADSDEEEEGFDLSPLKGSIPAKLKNSPEELASYLLQVLADTVGCNPDDLFNDDVIEAAQDAFESAEELKEKTIESIEEDSSVLDESEFEELLKELESDEPLQEAKEEEELDEEIGAEVSSSNSSEEVELQALFDKIEPEEFEKKSEPSLWDLAETELESQEVEGEELELTQLVSKKNKDELLVLFDAALEALEDRKLEAGYSTKIKTSVDKELDSEDLSIVFEKYADAAVKQHDESFSAKKKKPQFANVPKELPPIQFAEVQIVPLTKKEICQLILKSIALGFVGGVGHLWFFDLMESSRETILSHQLFWLALPHLAKNVGIALILAAGFFYFRLKNRDNAVNDAPLTL